MTASAMKGSLRAHIVACLRAIDPERVVIPCVGTFDLAAAAVEAGIDPTRVNCSDIGLYSAAVGTYLRTGEALHAPLTHPALSWLQQHAEGASEALKTACTVLALRYIEEAGAKPNRFREAAMREYREQAPVYLKALVNRLAALHETLHGLDFHVGDMRPVITRAKNDPKAVIVVAPPHRPAAPKDQHNAMINGYIPWRNPGVGWYDGPEELPNLVDALAHGKAPALIKATDDLEWGDPADMFGEPWQSVMVETQRIPTGSLAHWLCCNQPERVPSAMSRKDVPNRFWAAKYRLFHGEITPRSRIEVRTERVEIVNYYRDLLQHRLGLFGGTTQRMVLLVDGMLVAVLGFIHDHWLIDPERPMINVYCFAAPHARYNFQKLAVFAQHSSWFWDGLYDDLRGNPETIHTTMITRHPSSMQARGVMKLKKREQNPTTGEYQLLYTGTVQQRTPRECLAQWLQKWGKAA